MNKILKIVMLGCVGGFIGFSVWAVLYLANKTPDIEFDGPAEAGMIASTGLGFIVFGLTGLTLSLLKKF